MGAICTAEEKTVERVILFENAKCALDLNGMVDTEQNAFVADDVIKRLSAKLRKLLIDLDLPEAAFALMIFAEVRTSGTGFIAINAEVRFVTVRGRFGFFPTKAQDFAVFAYETI